MTDEFGPWESATVDEVRNLFTGAPFRWWLTGGVALDLFAGCSWRRHDDIDVGVCWVDLPAVSDWLGHMVPSVAAGGRLRPWNGQALSEDRHENNIWVKRTADGPFLFDMAIGAGDGERWRYRRDPRISRPWDEAVLTSPEGVPYLAPEIQLLFKSKNARPKDDLDAETVIPLMDGPRRQWLRQRLPDGHPWQQLIDGCH